MAGGMFSSLQNCVMKCLFLSPLLVTFIVYLAQHQCCRLLLRRHRGGSRARRNVMNRVYTGLLGVGLFLTVAPTVPASTWYVNGVTGNNSNSCESPTTACKTIGHAISLASSGDSIMVAPAIYTENLTLSISLTVIGSSAATTIVDGRGEGTVFTIAGTARVNLSRLTIRHGRAPHGGGIYNNGALTINNSIMSGNTAAISCGASFCDNSGGGIY